MTKEMREAMGAAAVRAAEAIGYKGAGTVEFIVDASEGLRADRFWFMEMNTRLQVEHPVSEAITGVDLVEWQLRVAAGEDLPAAQEDLRITGHAFEARLYAEDVPKGFLPATGTLTHLRFPDDVRADTAVRAGDTISPWYDPMIAKITVHGPTRAVALKRLSRALKGTEVAGTVTNLAFLGALAQHEGFAAGDVDTGLIGRDLAALTDAPAPGPHHFVAAAMAGGGFLDAPDWAQGFSLWTPLKRTLVLRWQEEDVPVFLEAEGPGRLHWRIGAAQVLASRTDAGWRLDGAPMPEVSVAGGVATVFDGYGIGIGLVDPLARDSSGGAGGNVIEAPMPGLVRQVLAHAGQAVAAGDRLAVLEAMKMEHALMAARDGVVAEVMVAPGDQVEAGAALIRLEDEEDAGEA